jgi:ABC-type transporter MlaC component
MKDQGNRKKAGLVTLGLLLILVTLGGCPSPASGGNGEPLPDSAPPTAASGGASVSPDEGGNAVFTLSTSHPADSVWKVYTQQEEGAERTDVSGADYDPDANTLTLHVTATSGWPLYCWVSVTEPGKNESSRIMLTILGPYTPPGVSAPPTVLGPQAAVVSKESAVQKSVNFTLSSAHTGTWKVYNADTGGSEVTGVSASFDTTSKTLTLSATGNDLAAAVYYVSVTENGKAESARLALTVGAYVPPAPTPAPAATVTTAAKTTAVQASVEFTLTSEHTGDVVWKVYNVETGGTALTGVTASFNTAAKALTLTAGSGNLAAGVYYVSVTQGALSESARLALTVGDYVHPASTEIPAVNAADVTKTSQPQAAVSFTLTSAGDGTWKVYGDNETAGVLAGVTASRSENNLTLTASGGDLAARDYYVSLTASGKTESLRLKLTVKAYADSGQTPQPTVAESTITKDAESDTSAAFTLTSTETGDWKVYDSNGAGAVSTAVTVSVSGTTLTLNAGAGALAEGEYFVSVTAGGKTESSRLLLTVKNPLFGSIQVSFTGPADETITLTGTSGTLSISANGSMIVTVTETFDTYSWYKDGVPVMGVTVNNITVYATDFAKGPHTLSVRVSKNDVVYSKLLNFAVSD